MLSYYNLVVSNAQAERSELAGYRVAPGAKAEVTSDTIRREVGAGRTGRSGGFVPRFALMLAASAALVFIGVQGAGAQEQSGMFADADGIEPPDMGVAYGRTSSTSVAEADADTSPQMTALLLDADGLEPPDTGFAYALPKRSVVAAADRVPNSEHVGPTADADGIEPPDIGVAYTLPDRTPVAATDQGIVQAGLTLDDDGLEPPDIGVAFDTDKAFRAYAERQQRSKRIAAQSGTRQ